MRYNVTTSTRNINGTYSACWVVTNIDEMRVAVFTTHEGLRHATIACGERGHLYNVDVIAFTGDLPNDGNIRQVLEDVKKTFLTDDKLSYFYWLKGVRDGRLNPPSQPNAVQTLSQRLAQIYTVGKRERYED
jgi:hypothetical protein